MSDDDFYESDFESDVGSDYEPDGSPATAHNRRLLQLQDEELLQLQDEESATRQRLEGLQSSEREGLESAMKAVKAIFDLVATLQKEQHRKEKRARSEVEQAEQSSRDAIRSQFLIFQQAIISMSEARKDSETEEQIARDKLYFSQEAERNAIIVSLHEQEIREREREHSHTWQKLAQAKRDDLYHIAVNEHVQTLGECEREYLLFLLFLEQDERRSFIVLNEKIACKKIPFTVLEEIAMRKLTDMSLECERELCFVEEEEARSIINLKEIAGSAYWRSFEQQRAFLINTMTCLANARTAETSPAYFASRIWATLRIQPIFWSTTGPFETPQVDKDEDQLMSVLKDKIQLSLSPCSFTSRPVDYLRKLFDHMVVPFQCIIIISQTLNDFETSIGKNNNKKNPPWHCQEFYNTYVSKKDFSFVTNLFNDCRFCRGFSQIPGADDTIKTLKQWRNHLFHRNFVYSSSINFIDGSRDMLKLAEDFFEGFKKYFNKQPYMIVKGVEQWDDRITIFQRYVDQFSALCHNYERLVRNIREFSLVNHNSVGIKPLPPSTTELACVLGPRILGVVPSLQFSAPETENIRQKLRTDNSCFVKVLKPPKKEQLQNKLLNFHLETFDVSELFGLTHQDICWRCFDIFGVGLSHMLLNGTMDPLSVMDNCIVTNPILFHSKAVELCGEKKEEQDKVKKEKEGIRVFGGESYFKWAKKSVASEDPKIQSTNGCACPALFGAIDFLSLANLMKREPDGGYNDLNSQLERLRKLRNKTLSHQEVFNANAALRFIELNEMIGLMISILNYVLAKLPSSHSFERRQIALKCLRLLEGELGPGQRSYHRYRQNAWKMIPSAVEVVDLRKTSDMLVSMLQPENLLKESVEFRELVLWHLSMQASRLS